MFRRQLIVQGFGDRVNVEALDQRDESPLGPVTDIQPSYWPRSRSFSNCRLHDPVPTITAPVSRIYLDMILWNQLKDSQFTYSPPASRSATGLQTPICHNSTPISPTRLYRGMVAGLFGMVFTVSYLEQANSKSRVNKLISWITHRHPVPVLCFLTTARLILSS